MVSSICWGGGEVRSCHGEHLFISSYEVTACGTDFVHEKKSVRSCHSELTLFPVKMRA